MGASGVGNKPKEQLDSTSLNKLRTGGIRIIDSGSRVLSTKKNSTTGEVINRVQEYALVLNRRNNYSIRERIVEGSSSNVEFRVKSTYKDNAQAALEAWKRQKKEFDS